MNILFKSQDFSKPLNLADYNQIFQHFIDSQFII